MKQLLSLFLFLLPCLALAQYPSNGNQKITLGEQTSADGLIWRGVANDTNVITPFSDTSAYIILDTVNSKFYHYNRTNTYWALAGGGTAVTTFSGGTTGLTPSTATSGAVTLGGTLAVANGGTGSATQNFVDLTTTQSSIGGAKTFTTGIKIINNINADATNLFLSNNNAGTFTEATLYVSNNNSTNGSIFFETLGENFTTLGGFLQDAGVIGTGTEISNGMSLMVRAAADMRFYTSGHTNERMRIKSDGEVNIGYGATDNGAYKLQVNSQIFATNATIATSDIRFKENIQPLDKGLEIINKLKPVKFNFITTTENNFSEFDEIGFIAQDVEGALSTELFAKAVVKKLDEDKEDSALGLMTEKFIPILVKAIQEQQALIKALEQRIINLENK
jgi:hypothetical protein